MKRYKVYTIEKGLVETNWYDSIRGLTWHRVNGPAVICYIDGVLIDFEVYYINDIKHRLDGPAYIEYDINGNITYVEYCINGIAYTKEQYSKELLKLKVQAL